MSFRIGQGYDVHQLKSGHPLIIGGINIPHTKGIVAHSDGDVLIHAIIDAMLGATNLGDLGQHFPSSQDWQDASGIDMLTHISQIIKNKFSTIEIYNIDATIILEEPKLSSYISKMQNNIMNALDVQNISIKATTTDQLGFIGKKQGIAAMAICLIKL